MIVIRSCVHYCKILQKEIYLISELLALSLHTLSQQNVVLIKREKDSRDNNLCGSIGIIFYFLEYVGEGAKDIVRFFYVWIDVAVEPETIDHV